VACSAGCTRTRERVLHHRNDQLGPHLERAPRHLARELQREREHLARELLLVLRVRLLQAGDERLKALDLAGCPLGAAARALRRGRFRRPARAAAAPFPWPAVWRRSMPAGRSAASLLSKECISQRW
jgi:hypothetical protein